MKTLLLIDNHALLYRFFHALPPLTTPAGQPIAAVYGLANILLKILREQKPDYLAAVFDTPEPTFRDKIYQDYKIHRPVMPDELQSQVIEAHQLFKQFGVKTIEQAGYEADDLIGSLAAKFKSERDLAIVILSGDLDMLQLVDGQQVTVQFLKKGVSQTIIYDQSAVEQRYGLKSQQLPDLKGLLGDPSDNIPGVNGIGPKTATPLLQKFGSLENLFENLWELPDKISGKLENQKKAALFSKKLATIVTDIALPYQLADFRQGELASRQLIAYFSKLGFKSLVERLHRRSIVAGDQR